MAIQNRATSLPLIFFLAGIAMAADDRPGLAVPIKHQASQPRSSQRLVLAHYMPWYAAKPFSAQWGWHWTMNHFDPEKITNGQREIASEFYPLIGPYDSGDPQVLEYHLLLMKLAGIDGVIVDWYGLQDYRDYAMLHRNTERLVEQIERLKMKLVICYEDQTIPALVQGKRISSEDRVPHARRELQWLAKHWFPRECYVKIDDRPVLLSFGSEGLNDDEWKECLDGFETPVVYFSEHHRRPVADGAFDWPIPQKELSHIARFASLSRDWAFAIPVAYPRFVDIYAKAKISDGYGRVADNGGRTLQTTLEQAITSNSFLIQIATWNDWGEGTQIEPSRQFGYRDLELIQRTRREHIDRESRPEANDLRIPHRLWEMRRAGKTASTQLDSVIELIVDGQLSQARSLTQTLSRQ